MKIAFVMLAAGNSRRFGSNKLLYEIEGKPMYLLTLEKLKKASEKIPESEIIVVTQYEEIVKKAGEMKIPVFINPRPEDGISLSMQIGLMSVRDTDACLFTVSDQPWLEADTVVALTELFENEKKGMACIRWNGKTGNPCIFGQKYYEELMEISGDKGGKKIIKKHPEDGSNMALKLPKCNSTKKLVHYAYNICLYHHERYDGHGYPKGLKNDDIPLEAQVVGLADAYDALISERPYKRKINHGEAVRMIVNGECGSFSPKVILSFIIASMNKMWIEKVSK